MRVPGQKLAVSFPQSPQFVGVKVTIYYYIDVGSKIEDGIDLERLFTSATG